MQMRHELCPRFLNASNIAIEWTALSHRICPGKPQVNKASSFALMIDVRPLNLRFSAPPHQQGLKLSTVH